MKKRVICAFILTMMLCGCGEEETHQKPVRPSSTTATTAAAETTAEAQGEAAAADTTTTAAAAAETATETAAKTDDNTAATEAAPEATTVDAAYESAGSHVSLNPDDVFAGLFYDENDSTFSMAIDNIGNATYKVNISHKLSDNQTAEWFITGQFDGRAVLHYDNCSKNIMTIAEDGCSITNESVYTNGTGYIAISERDANDTGYVWADDVDGAGRGAFFKK